MTIVHFYWAPYKLGSVLVASGTMYSAGFITSCPGLLLILWTVWDELMHRGICKAMDMDYIVKQYIWIVSGCNSSGQRLNSADKSLL